jgi:hypothetical protein
MTAEHPARILHRLLVHVPDKFMLEDARAALWPTPDEPQSG